jgi:L-lactate dehydrogenase (cytochrome)
MALKGDEIAKHNNAKSCWVIIHVCNSSRACSPPPQVLSLTIPQGKAYDVTEFLPDHPGGQAIILKYAGRDASEEFEVVHPPDTLDRYLDKSKHLGPVDMATVTAPEHADDDPEELARRERVENMPPLTQCYNLHDFEAVARRVMKKSAWAYYSSGADDEIVGG